MKKTIAVLSLILATIPIAIAVSVYRDYQRDNCARQYYDSKGIQIPSVVDVAIADARCK
jgi:hypothetical protein